ncbi:MAG: polysaccharide biosynthesis/export family protein [Phycisphaerae bacterium]|nr:polysaccharide biosynthesis/export family protein [Phycisphaerae bacterium]
MSALKAGVCGLALSFVGLCCVGCANDILDPSQMGRFRPVPVVNVILESLGVADEPEPTYAGAESPRPEDLIDYEQDYTFGPGDILRISIYELRREGAPFINDYIVTESGRVSLPDIGQIRAEGLTEVKLEEEIKDILSPGILKNPSVTVLLMQSDKRKFSIYGQGVKQAGRFDLPRYTFRLTDAIALAGDVGQFNVSNIYVSRDVPVASTSGAASGGLTSVTPSAAGPADKDKIKLQSIEPDRQIQTPSPEGEMLELIRPFSIHTHDSHLAITSAELVTEKELEAMAAPGRTSRNNPGGEAIAPLPVLAPLENTASQASGAARVEWVFENGKWIPKQIGTPEPAAPAANPGRPQTAAASSVPAEPSAGEYGWPELADQNIRTRVIKIPIDKLKSGDPAYDIVIRSGDRISIPVDIIGEFWVSGNVNNQGMINLTGRPMTLKMAIAAAGGLGPLAWPKKVEVVRRIGRNKAGLMQEEIVLVDLEKIAQGQQPDFFIKPFDLVNVGTHGTSRWLAMLRNAFRANYGFGFNYDRNFAYDSPYDRGLW